MNFHPLPIALKSAYYLGQEFCKLANNDFYFGSYATKGDINRIYPREEWKKRKYRIEEMYKQMGLIEKLAFELGDESAQSGLRIPLKEPLKIS